MFRASGMYIIRNRVETKNRTSFVKVKRNKIIKSTTLSDNGIQVTLSDAIIIVESFILFVLLQILLF